MATATVIPKPVKIIIIGDFHDPVSSREDYTYPAISRGTVRDYIPAHVEIDEHLAVRINGHIINRKDWETKAVPGGSEVHITKMPGGIGALAVGVLLPLFAFKAVAIPLVFSAATSYLSSLFTDPPKAPDLDNSPAYGSDQVRTSAKNALPIPIIYGEQIAGGNLIRSTTGHLGGKIIGGQNYNVSIGGSRNNMMLGLCEGPIRSIAGYTVPQSQLWFGEPSGVPRALYQKVQANPGGTKTLSTGNDTKYAFKFTVSGTKAFLRWISLPIKSSGSPPSSVSFPTVTVQADSSGDPSGIDLFTPIVISNQGSMHNYYKTYSYALSSYVILPLGADDVDKDYWVVVTMTASGSGTDIGTTAASNNGNIKMYDGSWGSLLGIEAVAEVHSRPEPFIGSVLGIKVNGSPVESFASDGYVAFNFGTVDQESLPGSSGIVLEQSVEQKLPLNRTIEATTQNAVDGIGVVISFPSGFYKFTSGGSVSGGRLGFEIRYWIKDSPTKQGFFRFFDKITEYGTATLTYKVDFPTEKNKPSHQFRDQILDVEVKLTDNDGVQFPIIWKSLQEYSDDQAQTYPHTVTLELDTDIGTAAGPLGDVTTHVQGKLVHQYDASGNYDTYGYSDSPAWCATDLALNPRYGGGKVLTTSYVDLESAYDLDDDCNDQIPDGRGGSMNRWAIGLTIDEVKPLDDWLTTITAAADAKLLKIGNKLKFKPSVARSTSQTFSDGNTLAGTFKQTFIGKKRRPNIVQLKYRDAELDYAEEQIEAEVKNVRSEGDPDIPEVLDIRALTNRIRAFRLAERHARRIQYTEWTAEVVTFINAIAVEPGDVITLSASAMDPEGVGGRLKENAPGPNSIKIDKDFSLTSAGNNYQITVTSESAGVDDTQTATIDEAEAASFSAGDTIDITPSWTTTPSAGDVYSIRPIREQRGGTAKTDEPGGVEAEVVSMEITEDFFIKLQLVNYDGRVFDEPVTKNISSKNRLIPAPLTPDKVPGRPLSLRLKSKLGGASTDNTIECRWQKAAWPYAYKCAVHGRIIGTGINDRFRHLGDADANFFVIPNIQQGLYYEVAICPRQPAHPFRHHNPGSDKVIRRRIHVPRPYSANRTLLPTIP